MDLVQHLSLLFAVLSVGVMEYWYQKDRKILNYLVPAAMWLGHAIAFYTYRILVIDGFLYSPGGQFFTTWSAFLRFHAIFTIFTFVLIMSNIIHDLEGWVWKKITRFK